MSQNSKRTNGNDTEIVKTKDNRIVHKEQKQKELQRIQDDCKFRLSFSQEKPKKRRRSSPEQRRKEYETEV